MSEETDAELKEKLLADMRSGDWDAASDSIRDLGNRGWLHDGSLAGVSLKGANLELHSLHNVNLSGVDFSGASLYEAIFKSADLVGARFVGAKMFSVMLLDSHLENAVFDNADLRCAQISRYLMGASFESANMQGAAIDGDTRNVSLRYANLQNAFISTLDFCGADFSEANLQSAKLLGADFESYSTAVIITHTDSIFDAATILPDGTRWTPDTDWYRFTDPDHPDFWRSKDPLSPAYPGRK